MDVPRVYVPNTLLDDLFAKHTVGHHSDLWDTLPLLARVKNTMEFRDHEAVERAWEVRYESDGLPVLVNSTVYYPLRNLINHLQNALPIIPTHAQILRQKRTIGKHYDMKNEDGKVYHDDYPGVNDDNEPAGYKVQLTNFVEPSFFVAEAFGEPHHHIRIPPDTNTFVINEKTFPHGADMTKAGKYIVSIFGLIDTERHHELIDRSLEKYPDYAITF